VRKRDPANFLRRLRPATEPGNLRQALDGIRLLGWRKSWQVARSTATHGYWDWRYAPPEPDWEVGITPGQLLGRDDRLDGFTARFEAADLEVRFLAADLVRVSWHPGRDPIPYAIEEREWPPSSTTDLTVDLDEDGLDDLVSGNVLGLGQRLSRVRNRMFRHLVANVEAVEIRLQVHIGLRG